ncbi:MAG: SDR family oxidoreductase [Verrucomicrobiota bacterium]|nr:3-oxoacyl-ACP reductase [Verrucomicrobiales bacterium]MEC9043141.1 SDR family oxidoreductase [Verrucomicrobiota bacterium]MED5258576.1 SDR family oxidoreductase [Verrucomicrobiota bacterium]MED5456338.1 SDR family oxidoreductase [Verrucomicrobiota bacterium]|tara:strand:- start:359 stop:1114 length:756 start_codon:yes stop_codon:yes gene_type:complete
MAQTLKNHVALITGSTTGLGYGIAKVLGLAGAKVVMNYYNDEERANRAFSEFQSLGCEGILVRGNAIDENSVQKIVEEGESKFGEIDIVVPNATPDQPLKPIEEYDWEFYQQMINFFVKSPYLLTRATIGKMKQKQWGRIINISSEVYQLSVSPFSAYVSAKGGQIGWTRSMSKELAPFGITVNTVNPGWIPTERHNDDPQEDKDAYLEQIPAGRWGVPEDVGEAVAYFASEEASFITGQTICVNGGNSPW